MAATEGLGILRRIFPLAASLALAGCPFPLPHGYQATSRENVPAEPLDWLAAGVTTRTDVLLKLGEADGAAPDGSWLAYGSAYSHGGVVLVFAAGSSAAAAGGESVEYRRLIISFDAAGVVTAVDFVTRDCWEAVLGMGSSWEQSPPCVKIGERE
jgi:outer membrane protein assembly factor BamE (lipoprotein component of BamABCDE complex)